jgi:hypothetical protein
MPPGAKSGPKRQAFIDAVKAVDHGNKLGFEKQIWPKGTPKV